MSVNATADMHDFALTADALGMPPVVPPLRVRLSREPFDPIVTLTMEDGSTEDLDTDEAKAWFKLRGAKMDTIDLVLDHVWNFGRATVVVHNPKAVARLESRLTPRL